MKQNIRQQFGSRIRQLRVGRGESQEGFANQHNIGRSYLSRLERGQANPSLEAMNGLAEALGVELASLFLWDALAEPKAPVREFVPYAADGTHFDKKRCKHPDGVYTVGEKEDTETFTKYEDALDYLRRMGTAKWKRPNVNGNWGLVTATSWRERPKP